MKKFIRKFLIWASLVLSAFLLLLLVFAAMFEDAIGMRLLKEANKQFLTVLSAENVELSLISDFPNASAELQGVTLESTIDNQPLLKAELVEVQLSIWSLFEDHLHIKGIRIEDGTLSIIQSDAKGQSNYHLLDPLEANPNDAQEAMSLSIGKAVLKNVELLYLDVRKQQKIRGAVKQATFSGRLRGERLYVESELDVFSKYIELEGLRYANNKRISCQADVDINLQSTLVKMDRVMIGMDDTKLQIGGWIKQTGNGLTMDLSAYSSEGTVESVIDLIPSSAFQDIIEFEDVGKFRLDLTAKGRYSKYSMPQINGQVSLQDGTISSTYLIRPLKKVSFQALYSNGKDKNRRSSVFELRNFAGYCNHEPFRADLSLSDFDNLFVKGSFNGILPVQSMSKLIPRESGITAAGGSLGIQDLSIQGLYNELVDPAKVSGIDVKGSVVFDRAMFETNDSPITLEKGAIQFDGNQLILQDLNMQGSGIDIRLDGTFDNLLAVLFSDVPAQTASDLYFKGSLSGSLLDVNRLTDRFSAYRHLTDTSGLNGDTSTTSSFWAFAKTLHGSFETRLDEFSYGRFSGSALDASFKGEQSEWSVSGSIKTMGGQFNVEGTLDLTENPAAEFQLTCTEVDVNELFERSDNFGQDVITSAHLEGILTANMTVRALWDDLGTFQYDKLHVLSDLRIHDGELKEFELLYDYSDYVDLEELRHIRFTTLQNWLEIKDGQIFIPVMFVQSTALNLTLSGVHSFDQAIDYYIKVNAGQVLSEKLKAKRSVNQMVPAKRKDWFNLYMHIYGHIDAFAHENNTRAVKSWFKSSDLRKQAIQKQLMEIFGPTVHLEEPINWRDEIPEYLEESNGTIDYIDNLEINGG